MPFFDTILPFLFFFSFAVMSVLAFCLWFLKTPNNPALDNYRISRKFLAISYLLLALTELSSIFADNDASDVLLTSYICLTIASLQSFLFTYSLITLLNIRFAKRRKVVKELIPIVILSILLFTAFALKIQKMELITYILFSSYYLSLLIRYSFLFFKQKRKYCEKMDNFYSEQESKRLDWVKYAFIGALLVGILAMIMQVWKHNTVVLVFEMIYIPFYIFFAVKYINYSQVFHVMEPIMETNEETTPEEEYDEKINVQIEKAISNWISNKKYLAENITINGLANEIGTNRTYLSSYINSQKQMNFKTWINYLKIEEAKVLLKQYTELSILEIGEKVGYTDQSNFCRQFKRYTNTSPSAWKKVDKWTNKQADTL